MFKGLLQLFIFGTLIFFFFGPDPERTEEQCISAGYKSCAQEEVTKDRIESDKKKSEDKRRAKEHCFSAWDGAHRNLESLLKKSLKDPDSYDHIETRFKDRPAEDKQTVYLSYRAKNGFGGMSIGKIVAETSRSNCSVLKIISQS